jgi:hypothetical protein
MADRFIIQGSTYNGDGTTSAAASSDGGVGAWNNLTYMYGTTPAYGTLPIGTTVYVRSKDAANADITVTLTANITIGLAAATEAAPVKWIIDDGTTWPGYSGTVTFLSNNTSWYATIAANNIVVSLVKEALVFRNTKVDFGYPNLNIVNNGILKNALIDGSAKTSNTDGLSAQVGPSSVTDSCHFKLGRLSANPNLQQFSFSVNSVQKPVLLNCGIELTSNVAPSVGGLFSSAGNFSGEGLMLGGRIYGPGAMIGEKLGAFGTNPYSQVWRFIGVQIPASPMMVINAVTPTYEFSVEMMGTDGAGTLGGHIENYRGFATSRTDNNPPTRQAMLPDGSNTPWAWRIWPVRATVMRQWQQVFVSTYSGAAATVTATMQMLVSTVAAPDKSTCWIEATYIDNASGVPMMVSSQLNTATALDVSSVTDWSTLVWGAITFNKNQLRVTTPTTVKPNSIITVNLRMGCGSSNANAVYFVDPDVALT